MELYVSHLLSFLIVTVYSASLLPCSVCTNAQFEYCLNTSTCGSTYYDYPFGVGNRGCGLAGFQIDCVQNSSRLFVDRSYSILQVDYHNKNYIIFRDENCQFLNDPFNMQIPAADYSDPFFRITEKENKSLAVFKCNTQAEFYGRDIRKCNASVCYSLADLDYAYGGCSVEEISVGVVKMTWVSNYTDRETKCQCCEDSGGICGYDISFSTAPFVCHYEKETITNNCTYQYSSVAVSAVSPVSQISEESQVSQHTSAIITIVFSAVGLAVFLAVIAWLLIYFNKRRKKPSSPRNPSSISMVEEFLRDYAYEMPSRYSFSALKRITNNFTEKLGEGGFGVVYKGKLQNGTLVAVKLLDRHRQGQTQFMNEVATIGRIRNVNLVRLLGYCFESPISAVVYDFMVNGSLEKFIFARKEEGQILTWEQLYSFALGAARGIGYLHQDCEKRIIHFDLKPHNILLDTDFTPKVSDFGLAKLCRKEDDHVSMTAGRGTPGYVAPEVCHRDLGPVTDKSDVYSFGMLLLEIVGGRKNIDWKVSHSSQFYFPEWAFKLLESGEFRMRLRGGEEIEAEDEEKARRLTKVGLWCIQYNSSDRPCMMRVVQMLEGNGDDVTDPPLPSAASEKPPVSASEDSSTVELRS